MSNESKARIQRLQVELGKQNLDGALITHPIDLFYFSGTRQNGALWIPVDGNAKLMVRKSLSRARIEAEIGDIIPFPSSKIFAAALPDDIATIGLTFDVLPVQQFNYYQKLLPNVNLRDISTINRELRSIKSDAEIAIMHRGGEQLCNVFAQIPEFLKKGAREVDVAAEFEMRLRKAGGEGYVRMRAFNQELFQGLTVAGKNGCTPGFFDGAVTGHGMSKASPHGASSKTIQENEPVLIDYTGVFEGYILDMTRMFVVGHMPEELNAAFKVSLAIQKAVSAAMLPGAVCSDIFELAWQMADDAGFGGCFMGAPGEQAKFVGHGVGLELDEMPVLARGFDVPLQLNQTIAVEPKFVFQDIGVVGIENTFVVTEGGGGRLTPLDDKLVEI
jgi:Xaa-Pro aminopeptidase